MDIEEYLDKQNGNLSFLPVFKYYQWTEEIS